MKRILMLFIIISTASCYAPIGVINPIKRVNNSINAPYKKYQLLAVNFTDSTLYLLSTNKDCLYNKIDKYNFNGKIIQTIKLPFKSLYCVSSDLIQFNSSKKHLLYVKDNSIFIYNITENKTSLFYKANLSYISKIKQIDNDFMLVFEKKYVYRAGKMRYKSSYSIINMASHKIESIINVENEYSGGVVFNLQCDQVFIKNAVADNVSGVYMLKTGELIQKVKAKLDSNSELLGCQWSNDGSHLLLSLVDPDEIILFNVKSGTKTLLYKGPNHLSTGLARFYDKEKIIFYQISKSNKFFEEEYLCVYNWKLNTIDDSYHIEDISNILVNYPYIIYSK